MKTKYHMTSGFITFAFSALFLFSCASGYLYYTDLNRTSPLKGTVALASFQLRASPVTWTVQGHDFITKTTLRFTHPEIFFKQLLERLEDPVLERILVKQISPESVDQSYKRSVLEVVPYNTIPGCIPVFDDKFNHSRMDKMTLDILNCEIDADYYLVFDGDIIDFEIPMIINAFEFSLTYEISVVIYDNTGTKVFSRHYPQHFHRIQESHESAQTYYDYLTKTIYMSMKLINRDLDAVLPPPVARLQTISPTP